MDKSDSRHELIPAATGPDLITYEGQDGPAAELRAEIEASRRQIAQSLEDLQYEVESTVERITDWRGFVGQHPLACVGAAAAFGFYLGLR